METKNGKKLNKMIFFEKYHNEYGSISPCILNSYKKKTNENGTITYYYIASEESENTIYRNGMYLIPVELSPEDYKKVCKQDWEDYKDNFRYNNHTTPLNKFYDDENVEIEENLPLQFYEESISNEDRLCEDLDFNRVIDSFCKVDRYIAILNKNGYSQSEIADKLHLTQSAVSKRLYKIKYALEYNSLNNGTLSKQEIEFEIARKEFLLTYKMQKNIDVIFEIYKWLLPLGGDLYYIKRFFTIRELLHFAYKTLFLYDNFDNVSIEKEIKLLPPKRQEIYHNYIESEKDIYKYLFAKLETEAIIREKVHGKISAKMLFRFNNKTYKIAKSIGISNKEYLAKRAFKPLWDMLQKRLKKANAELPKHRL